MCERYIGDCIYFSQFTYLLLKNYNEKFAGEKFKYISIKKQIYNDGEFHQFITFKYKNVWYYLDRFECDVLEQNQKGKKIKFEGEWESIGLALYINKCGFKNENEMQENIYERVNSHLLKITGLKFY